MQPCQVNAATFAPAVNSYFFPFTNSVPKTSANPLFNSNVTFSFFVSTSNRNSQSGSNLNSCVCVFSSTI